MSDGSISLPAPDLVVPAQGESMFPVRMREWARLKEKIDDLKRHKRQWTNAGWAFIGVGASGVLSWLPYVINQSAHELVPMVTIVLGVLFLGVGIVALFATGETQRSIDEAVRQAKVHMFDMESGLTDEQRKQIAAMAAAVIDL